jgi:SAM-dependent methyltransferase
MAVFYESASIPVHSCMMLPEREAALAFPKGDLALGHCPACGFIGNTDFDASRQHYTTGYEEQQSFSPRFRRFQSELVARLIERYDLRGKDVVEIGCGKGDFLIELGAAGGNRGIGIDPACDPQRVAEAAGGRVRFIAECYGPTHADLPCDFLCCRHTLEHIPDTLAFMTHLRRVIGDRDDLPVFIEVPDVRRVLREQAFWDIYYEHCSYFSLGSLARVFRRAGFEILELERDYDDQYLLIVGRPASRPTTPKLPQEDDLAGIAADVATFKANIAARIRHFRQLVRERRARGQRVAIWGSGSKCVSFLSTVGVAGDIAAVLDINPYRQGKYLAGSGMVVSAPESLRENPVEAILVMNPIYTAEIAAQLDELKVKAELIPC